VIDVLTDDAIYEVKANLSTATAQRAIGELQTLRLARPERKLVIACSRVATGRGMIQAISDLGIEIIALDGRLT
jgi:predicted Fe-Mo cluster-binding NifX family protein